MALINSPEPPKWFHSDRNSEYHLKRFETQLLNINISVSLNPWYNSSQESWLGRFKFGFGDFERFNTLPELIEGICSYISYYNNKRVHTKIKMAPVECRIKYCLKFKIIRP